MTDRVAGVVLAGGQSRRMGGGDKGQRILGGRPMIAHVIERLSPQVNALAINSNADPQSFADHGLPVLADCIEGYAGPLAGVLTGLQWAADNPAFTHVVTAATDTPFFPHDLVARFVVHAAPDRIVMARSGGNRHPVFALWPVALRDDLTQWMASSDTMKVLAWAGRHDLVFCDFEYSPATGMDPFFNANTPEEFAEAEALLREGKP